MSTAINFAEMSESSCSNSMRSAGGVADGTPEGVMAPAVRGGSNT